jgi:peptidoglycan/xylan/chitin deacetylase (PgdA/CDA1 family)
LAALAAAWSLVAVLAARRAPAAPPAPPVYRVATTVPAMALGINVVWGTEYVPGLLKALEAAHAEATFFLGGAWAEQHPALVRLLVARGMEIGNHGYAHRHQSRLSFDANVAEIARASRAIELAGAPRPTLFAPPYGDYNATVLRAAASLHLTVVMWTIDPVDWRPSTSAADIVRRVLAGRAAGAIVLLHPTAATDEALPVILRDLAESGYRVVTVGALLKLGEPRGETNSPSPR